MTRPGLFESTLAIRFALASHLDAIQRLDALPRERERTGSLRTKLLRGHSRQCPSCLRPRLSRRTLQAAHLLALEDGGLSTEDNVVILCRDCHLLYDQGYASLAEVRMLKERRAPAATRLLDIMRGRQKDVQPRQPIVRPLPAFARVYRAVQARHYRKALRLVQSKGHRLADQQVSRLVEGQIERRRAAVGSLERAIDVLHAIDFVTLAPDRRPLYHYELGYTMQRRGWQAAAMRCFRASEASAKALRDKYGRTEALIGRIQRLAAEIITLPAGAERRIVSALDRQLVRTGRACADQGGTFGGRWHMNAFIWRANLFLKCGTRAEAQEAVADLVALRDSLNLATGWTADSRGNVTALRGLALMRGRVSRKVAQEAIRLLVRATVPLLMGYSQAPEGIRDRLLGLERALSVLQRQGKPIRSLAPAFLRSVRRCTRDGSSVLDPYRADPH